MTRPGLELRETRPPHAEARFQFLRGDGKIDLAEDVFGTSLLALTFDNPSEIVEHLVGHLRGWGPDPLAADFLKKLAQTRNNPALAKGLHRRAKRRRESARLC